MSRQPKRSDDEIRDIIRAMYGAGRSVTLNEVLQEIGGGERARVGALLRDVQEDRNALRAAAAAACTGPDGEARAIWTAAPPPIVTLLTEVVTAVVGLRQQDRLDADERSRHLVDALEASNKVTVSEHTSALSAAGQRVGELELRVETLTQECDAARRALAEQEIARAGQIAGLETRLAEAEMTTRAERKVVESLQGEITALRVRLGTLEAEAERANASAAVARVDAETLRVDLVAARTRIADLEPQLAIASHLAVLSEALTSLADQPRQAPKHREKRAARKPG